MKLYHLSQTENTGYDTYSDMVVAAEDEHTAKRMHPYTESERWSSIYYDDNKLSWINTYSTSDEKYVFEGFGDNYGTWVCDLEKIKVVELGEANDNIKEGVICASFHAG